MLLLGWPWNNTSLDKRIERNQLCCAVLTAHQCSPGGDHLSAELSTDESQSSEPDCTSARVPDASVHANRVLSPSPAHAFTCLYYTSPCLLLCLLICESSHLQTAAVDYPLICIFRQTYNSQPEKEPDAANISSSHQSLHPPIDNLVPLRVACTQETL
jgi:hypothetical protein